MNTNLVDAIRSRRSVRSFDSGQLSIEDKTFIQELFAGRKPGPFGGSVRFALLDLNDLEKTAVRSMGTYGIIRNAPLYVGAVVNPGPDIFIDLGYLFEEAIIKLTARGFGTCWMGGTFTRASFAAQAAITGSEILAVISPIGRPAAKRSFMETVIRTIAGSRNRKDWQELFFNNNGDNPLVPEDAGKFSLPLECLRAAPSASNKQPWRLIMSGNQIHFFLERTEGYQKLFKKIDIQSIDMGIAMYHFEAAALECGIPGKWRRIDSVPGKKRWEYIAGFSPCM